MHSLRSSTPLAAVAFSVVAAGTCVQEAIAGASFFGQVGATCSCCPAAENVPVVGHGVFSLERSGSCNAAPSGVLCSTSQVKSLAESRPGFLRLCGNGQGQQFTPSPQGCGAGGSLNASVLATSDDLIFTDPSNPSSNAVITFTMNMVFASRLEVAGPEGSASANLSFSGMTGVTGSMLVNTGGLSTTGDVNGYANDGSAIMLVSDPIQRNLNSPVTLTLSMAMSSASGLFESSDPSTVSATGVSQLRLPVGLPVFNLPAGITADSVQLNIINNIWQGLPADINLDGAVDVDDLLAVINGWGPCPRPSEPCAADFNLDGVVDVDDLLNVINHWSP